MPGRDPDFTGREEQLTAVRTGLLAGGPVVVHSARGTAGVGKSQLAIEYAHRHADDYALTWWLDCESRVLLGQQYAELALHLGHATRDSPPDEMCRAAITALLQHPSWLLVFDNVMDPATIQQWLPGGPGHVLLTSYQDRWSGLATAVPVGPLPRAESIRLLQRRVPGFAVDDADALADALGDLPLTLALADALIAETGAPPAEYVRHHAEHAVHLTRAGMTLGPRDTVTPAVSQSWMRLRFVDPDAALLAAICANLAHWPIPVDWLTTAAPGLPPALAARLTDDSARPGLLDALTRSGLARLEDAGLVMHRYVPEAIRRAIRSVEPEALACAITILTSNAPPDPESPAAWPTWARLYPHLPVLPPRRKDTGPALDQTVLNAVRYLISSGNLSEAETRASRLHESWQYPYALGPDHEDTLRAAAVLAAANRALGRHLVAEIQGTRTLNTVRRLHGDDHPSTLTAASDLADTLSDMGDHEAARDMDADTLMRRRQVLGRDHPDTRRSAEHLVRDRRALRQTGGQAGLRRRVEARGYRRPPATVAFDDLRRQGLPPVLFAHAFLPEGVTILDVRGFAALVEQAHHDRALLTLPDGEDGAVLVRGFPNNGLAEWRIITPDPPLYTWPLRMSAAQDGHRLCTFLPAAPRYGKPVAAPPITFTIQDRPDPQASAEAGQEGDGGVAPFGPMNGMGYRRPPATVAFADLRSRGLPEVIFSRLFLPEGATACDLEVFGAMIEDAYRTPGILHVHPDLDADGNEQCTGIGAERTWTWDMALRPEPADDGEYYGGLHQGIARLLLTPGGDGTRQAIIVPHGGGARPAADPAPVTFTIQVGPEPGNAVDVGDALSRLDADAPAATALLRALAFLAPEPVPFSLLLAVPKVPARAQRVRPSAAKRAARASLPEAAAEVARVPFPKAAAALAVLVGDPIASGNAVHLLRRHGLIAWAGGDREVVSPQARAAVRASLKTPEGWPLAAAALVEAALPADPRDPASWPAFAALRPHARAAFAVTSDLTGRLARYLGESGDYRGARELWSLIADARAAEDGPSDPRTVVARLEHARWTGTAGDAVGARDALAALLPLADQVLGPDAADTLDARHDLASMTGFAGDPSAAREQLLVVVPTAERVLGLDHLVALRARASLAHWTGVAGDPVGARDRFGLLVGATARAFSDVFNPETGSNVPHPETLRMQAAAIPWYGKAGDPHGARNQAWFLLQPYLVRVFGAAHPDILRIRRELARWSGLDGDPRAARDELAELLPAMETALGAEHPRTVAVRTDLASWTEKAE